jgi:PKD repeat protein
MKPSLTLTLISVALLSACARGNPTGPSQPSNSVQQSNAIVGTLKVAPDPAVTNEPTTFIASIASAPSSVSATLDFGDGTRGDFGPLSPGNSATLKHIYTRAGSFTATFSVTNAAGATALVSSIPVIVRWDIHPGLVNLLPHY